MFKELSYRGRKVMWLEFCIDSKDFDTLDDLDALVDKINEPIGPIGPRQLYMTEEAWKKYGNLVKEPEEQN